MITLKEIARLANVSYTTVSNVVNGNTGRVSQTTIEKINAILKETGYIPNMYARSLVQQSSRVIAYIELHPANRFDSPFVSSLIETLESALHNKDYYLMVRRAQDKDDLIHFLKCWNVDGLFFTGLGDPAMMDVINNMGIPTVTIDSYSSLDRVSNVRADDCEGGYLATRHLLDNGHRRIAVAFPSLDANSVDEQRLEGYRKALGQFGIPFDDSLLFDCTTRKTSGIQLGEELARLDGLTAVFATSDMLALEIMAGLRQAGKAVPDDMSIVGFDDARLSRLSNPTLTTIHQSIEEKGQIAVQFMIDRIENKGRQKIMHTILPVKLVGRQTVRRIGALKPLPVPASPP